MFKLKIPPPVYALSIAGLMWLLNQYFPLVHWLEAPWNSIGLVLMGLALVFDLWSLVLFFKVKTTPNPMKPEKVNALVTSGLYQVSRNPMYVGLLVLLFGFSLWLGSVTPFLLLPLFVFLITTQQIKPEEAVLTKVFGKEYLEYKAQVRRWL
ncbi:MAG: isoprenylcysteine carboxylmethyltransferase family protein [Cocleimonas sp.]|nr:isoprenylcysteine carboxylmethyltransferase family protein [Cocleimonas sp.]